MNDFRETPRIDAKHLIAIKSGDTPSGRTVEAMVLNMSLDGALIETWERLNLDALVLSNQYKDKTVSIRATVVHQTDLQGGAYLFGPYRTGVEFTDDHRLAKEFIVSVVKCQEKASSSVSDNDRELPPGWMDTNQINEELFSTDTFEDDEEEELHDIHESLGDLLIEKKPAPSISPKPRRPVVNEVSHTPVTTPQPSSRPPQPKAPVRRGTWLVHGFLGLTALVLGASLVIFRTPPANRDTSMAEKLGIEIPFVGERPAVPERPDQTDIGKESPLPAVLLRKSITSAMVPNETLGPLFVIRGNLNIAPGHRLEDIRVEAKLFNKTGNLITSARMWPGQTASDQSIARFDSDDLDEIQNLYPDAGADKTAPFIFIFKKIPPDIESYTVDLQFQ